MENNNTFPKIDDPNQVIIVDEKMRPIYKFAYEQMKEGKTDGDIFDELTKLGIDETQSNNIIHQLLEHKRETQRQESNK